MTPTSFGTTLVAAAFLLTPVMAGQSAAQSDGDLKCVMRIETAGQPAMEMNYALGDGKMRMDLDQGMSVIWTSGDAPSMLMVQHAQQRYIEWGPDQLKMMQQMLQRMPGADADAEPDFDPSQIRFEETGQTEQINGWDAFEVRVTGLQDQDGAFWMTRDIETGLFEISGHVADAAEALRMPMAGGGATGGTQALLRYRSLIAASDMPDGRVVRMNFEADGNTTSVTLMSMEPGPLPADTFTAPAGYEQMQMPSIPE